MAARTLMITIEDMDVYVDISKYIREEDTAEREKVEMHIFAMQNTLVKPLICTKLYNQIITQLATESITDQNRKLLHGSGS